MMNGLETLIYPTEGFAARESCTDTSKKESTVCMRVYVCVRGEVVCVLGRCDGLVIGRWDKAEIWFSLQKCVSVSECVLTVSWPVRISVMHGYWTCSCAYFYDKPVCSSAAMTGLYPGRCMAMLLSNSAQAHPYPSLLSALSNSVL